MMSFAKHSVRALGIPLLGGALLAMGTLLTACEPADEGVTPREPAPREPAPTPTPRDTDPYDPYEDPDTGTGTQPGTGTGTQPGGTGTP